MQVTVLPLKKKVIEKIVVVHTRGFLFSFLRLFQKKEDDGNSTTLLNLPVTRGKQASKQASDNKQTTLKSIQLIPTPTYIAISISPFPYSFFLTVNPQPTCMHNNPTIPTSPCYHVTISPYPPNHLSTHNLHLSFLPSSSSSSSSSFPHHSK